jgi:hypothetical protein
MSELINNRKRENFRRNLLANASLFALLGYFGVSQAAADEETPPPLWIELGGQAEQMDNATSLFAPSFLDQTPAVDRAPMVGAQKSPKFSIGGEGKISFAPEDTNWVFSASFVYGRSTGAKHDHQQTPIPYVKRYFGTQIIAQPGNEIFGDGQTEFRESHLVVDFQAGKDVGLGLFGSGGKSVVSAGVRFAQFTSRSTISLHARPHYTIGAAYSGHKYLTYQHASYGYRTVNRFRHTYTALLRGTRNTRALGPSISWNASVPIVGNGRDMTLTMDWGAMGAILFGRQKVHIQHQTSSHYFKKSGRRFKYPYSHYTTKRTQHGPYDHERSRTVTIPNVGGFAGVSLKFTDVKFSVGYRADFFFHAVDSGIDAPRESNQNFYGPFATISIGIGG